MKGKAGLMRKISLALLSYSLIIASIILPMSMANYRAMPFAYAQTNAAMLTGLAGADSNVTSNAAANAITSNTSKTTTTAGELQIKRDVNYFDSSSGYLVYPSSATTGTKLTAVIMIHEWWGINDNIRSMANALAKEGYVVLAADLFRGQSTNGQNQAMQLIKTARSNPQQSISNLQAAVNYISSLPFVDGSKISSIG
jgi:carboxymethylenebutenolidase